jgi:hypothetical protein
MIRGRTLGPTRTFTPCSRGGSGAANTRRGPSCRRKQNWRTNSAAGPTPPPGRSGRSNATGWPGGFSEEGTYRPDRMLIQASHDAPSRLCPQATSGPAAVCISGLPPYSRVDRDHQRDVGFADVRSCISCGPIAGHPVVPSRAFCQHVARHDACGHERCAAGARADGCRQAVMAATSAPGVLAARAGRPAGARGRFRALAGRSPASAVATSGRADAGAGSPGIR